MAETLTLSAALNFTMGSLLRGREFEKEMGHYVENAVEHGLKAGAKVGGRNLEKEMTPAITRLMKAGLRGPADAFKKSYKELGRKQYQTAQQVIALQEAADKTRNATVKKQLLAEKAVKQKLLKEQINSQKKMGDVAEKKTKDVLALRDAYEKKLDRTKLEKAQDQGEAFNKAVSTALSADNIDLSSLTSGIGGALSGVLKGGAGAAAGAGAGATAASLASVAAGVAAVVGPLAAFAAILGAAYGQTKDMNKAFLENVTAADLNAKSTESLKVKLGELRRVTIDTAYDFRMSKEEVAGFVTSLNDAGLTVREFRGLVRGSTTDLEAYASVTRTAIAASQGLGVSSSDVADFMNTMQRDMGQGLNDIQGAFGMIYSEAAKAGMSTKDFFSAINSATSGMALYNFRVEDTVGLFTDLVDILGEDLAKEQIGLQKTFAGMGMQERYKTAMLGGGAMSRAVQGSAMYQGKNLAEDLKKAGIQLGGGLMGEAGGPIDMQRLASMTGDEFGQQLAILKAKDPALARKLSTTRTAAQSLKGGTGNVAMGMGGLDRLGELAAQMSLGASMSGGKLMAEMGPMQRMMMEEVTGMAGEQFDQVARIQQGMMSEYKALQALGDESVQGKTFEEAVTSGSLSQTEDLKEASEKQYTMMEKSAQDQLKETRSMSQTISNRIAQLLESIGWRLDSLLTMFSKSPLFGGGASQEERQKATANQEAASKQLDLLGAQIVGKEADLAMAPEEKKAAIQKEIDNLKAQAAAEKEKVKTEGEVLKRISQGESGEDARRGVTAEAFEEKYGMSPEEFYAQNAKGADKVAMGRGMLIGTSEAGGSKYGGDTNRFVNPAAAQSLKKDLASGDKSLEDAWAEGAQVTFDEEKKISAEQIGYLATMADTAAADKVQADTLQVEEDSRRALWNIEQEFLGAGLSKVAGATGMSYKELLEKKGTKAGQASIKSTLGAQVDAGAITREQANEALALLRINESVKKPAAKDFIYQGDGTRGQITPINKADTFVGMMPGGAIDGMGKGGGGMGGGGKTVNVYINGGDEARFYAILKKVLSETGYGSVKRYG